MERLRNIENNMMKIFLKGIVLAFIISLGLTFLLAVVLNFINISDGIIDFIIMFISSFSILITTFIIGRKLKKNGIFIGCILGISYVLVLYIISSIINMNFIITIKFLEIFVMSLIFGIIGGIIGVNLK